MNIILHIIIIIIIFENKTSEAIGNSWLNVLVKKITDLKPYQTTIFFNDTSKLSKFCKSEVILKKFAQNFPSMSIDINKIDLSISKQYSDLPVFNNAKDSTMYVLFKEMQFANVSSFNLQVQQYLDIFIKISPNSSRPKFLLIVFTDDVTLSTQKYEAIFKYSWKKKFLDFSILQVQLTYENSNVEPVIYTFNPFYNSIQISNFNTTTNIFTEKLNNVNGYNLKLPAFSQPPHIKIIRDKKGNVLDTKGVNSHLIEIVSEKLNFTRNYSAVSNSSVTFVNLNFVMENMLIDNADVLTAPLPRYNETNYLYPGTVLEADMGFIIEDMVAVVPILEEDKLNLTFTLFLTMFLALLTRTFLSFFTKIFDNENSSDLQALDVFGLLFGISVSVKSSKFIDKLICIFTSIVYIIFSTDFFSNITHTSVIRQEIPFNTFKEISESSLEIYVDDIIFERNFVRDDPYVQAIKRKVIRSPGVEECLVDLNKKKNVMCICSRSRALLASKKSVSKIATPVFISIKLVYLFQGGSPFFDRFKAMFQGIYESGIYNYVKQRNKDVNMQWSHEEEGSNTIQRQQLGSMIFCGSIISVIAFISELILHRITTAHFNLKTLMQHVQKFNTAKVAVKIIDTSKITQEYVIKNLSREAKLLSLLNHPSIVRLFETIHCGPVYYLVTELATGGDLCSHVRSQPGGRLDEPCARLYTRQLAAALRHMHSRDIVHRDLKMENIMLQDEKKDRVKIVDFGLGNLFDDLNPLKTQCGSPEYAAPELFVKGKKYGPEVDLWSLGVVVYVMGTGRLPFASPRDGHTSADERRRRLLAQINRGIATSQERIILGLSSEFKSLVRRLLTPIAAKRMGTRELCHHPWLVDKQRSSDTLLEEECEKVDEKDHNGIVDELMNLLELNRQTVEVSVNNKRYGKIGGMYNIIVHELQRKSSNFKMHCHSTLRSLKRSVNQTYSSSNRDKVCPYPFKMKPSVNVNSMQMPSNTFSIAEYDRNSKKIIPPAPSRNHVLPKENSNVGAQRHSIPHRLTPLKKNLKKVDSRPMTQPVQKKVPKAVATVQNDSLRPLSEQVKHNRIKTHVDYVNKDAPPLKKSATLQRSVQAAHVAGHPPSRISRRSRGSSAAQTATVGQGDDRLADPRRGILRLARSRLEAPKLPEPLSSRTRESRTADAATRTKAPRDKDSATSKYCLKKPRSLMKSLDKLKWRNCIFSQEHLENKEKKKKMKTKAETSKKKTVLFTAF